jgi:hypothetical protein
MSSPEPDPRPLPPRRPRLEECCDRGCDPCVFDVYDAALDRYRSELRAWEARQALRKGGSP